VPNSKSLLRKLAWTSFVLSYALARALSFEYTGHTESPFLERTRPSASASEEPNITLELRGISVESGIPWLTLYDSTSKKWFTGKPGDLVGEYKIASFDLETSNVTVIAKEKTLVVCYKGEKPNSASNGAASSLAATEVAAVKVSPPPLSASESARLEQVSSQIRQRIALQQLRTTGHVGS